MPMVPLLKATAYVLLLWPPPTTLLYWSAKPSNLVAVELLNAKYQTKEVFVLKAGGFADVDYMMKSDGKWRWFAYESCKFWMPIPEPPKE